MSVALPNIPSPPTLCAPAPAMLLFRSGLATGSPWGLPAVLRTSFTARSLVSRIWPYRVCVVGRHWTHRSTDYLFTFSCSPPHLAVTQLLSVIGGKLHQRGTLTLLRTLTPKRTSATVPVAPVGVSPTGNGRSRQSLNRDSFGGGHVFGETPNTATETVALPILTGSLCQKA